MKKYAVVETVQTFFVRYVIPVEELQKENTDAPVEIDWAADSVVMEEAIEFSQNYLGENIIHTYDADEEQVIGWFKQENPEWSKRLTDQEICDMLNNWKRKTSGVIL